MRFRRPLSLLIVAFAFFAASASAQDFYCSSASTRSMALGGVYVPSTSDAIGALSTNPAGLTYLSSPTLDLSMSAVFARGSNAPPLIHFSRSAICPSLNFPPAFSGGICRSLSVQ